VDNILAGRGFLVPVFGLEFRFYVAPAYPVFLIPFRAVSDVATLPQLVGIVQAILGIGTAALIFITARRLGGRVAGFVAGAAVLFHPYLAFFGSRLITETLAVFLFALFLSLYLDRNAGPFKLGVSGAVLGVAALTRPVFLYIGILACICLLFRLKGEPWRRRALNAGVTAATLIIILAPWTIRNYALSGRLIPVAEISGRIMYQGNKRLITEGVPLGPVKLLRTERFRSRIATFAGDPVAVELTFQDFLREKALRAIRENKKEFLLLSARRFGHMLILRPTLSGNARAVPGGKFATALVTAFSVLLYVAAAVGFFTAPGRLPKLFLPLACLLNTGIHSLTISLLRYRLPVDLIFTLVAGFGVAALWRVGAGIRAKARPRPGGKQR
jgi:hypothetical protein